MLKSVLQYNPFENGTQAWMSVIQNLEEEIDFIANQRQVSDRCLFLLKKLWDDTLVETLNK